MARYRSDNLFQIILELSKVRITIAVAFTTITGYVLARNGYDAGFILPTLGIFFLACGSSVVNHLQEKKTDARMARTSLRPFPLNKISTCQALTVAALEFITGSVLLFFSAGLSALGLGWLAMFWYNVVYASLKRRTPNAVIPGSVIGAIPPLVGWVSAGGTWNDPQALVMAVFFFVWQVPHFYLLAAKYGHEYEKAGLPSLTSRYTINQIRKIVFIWIVLTVLAAMGLSLTLQNSTWLSTALILVISVGLIIVFFPLARKYQESFRPEKYFMRINYYVLAVVLVLLANPMIQKLLQP